ncbi:MAG: ABC transporter ATP-binding protein [Thermoanaerobaculia bacterium]|nr:ABC transporter ATP-binding protein [Thermoanaerobaculia bacterium]
MSEPEHSVETQEEHDPPPIEDPDSDEISTEEELSEAREATETASPQSGEPDVLVEVDGIVKHYGPIKAVDGLSFEVRRGEVLGFLGPNGAGKTTAMRIVTGFLKPDAGRVRLAGHDLDRESLEARHKLGYLPENAPAYGEMTVRGFLTFVAEARGIDDPGPAVDRVIRTAALERVEHQSVETLSKGYKRRVGLAQALIHDPEILILDEPTDGLDPNQKAMVQELISNLSEDKCIILSTHILDEVEKTCSRVMIIAQGQVLVDGTPEELLQRAADDGVPGEGRLDDLFRHLTAGEVR